MLPTKFRNLTETQGGSGEIFHLNSCFRKIKNLNGIPEIQEQFSQMREVFKTIYKS